MFNVLGNLQRSPRIVVFALIGSACVQLSRFFTVACTLPAFSHWLAADRAFGIFQFDILLFGNATITYIMV